MCDAIDTHSGPCDSDLHGRISGAFDIDDVFQGMANRSVREKVYRKHFNYVVSIIALCHRYTTNDNTNR